MIINDNIQEILKWDLEMLWNAMLEMILNDEISKEDEDLIRSGFYIKVPIYYLVKNWYVEYPITKSVIIKGHGRHKLKDFMKEVETRESYIRNIIIKGLESKSPIVPAIKNV